MHIGHTFANQLKGLGVIEEVQSLFVCQTCLLSKQLNNTGIFPLEKNRIGLHRLKFYGFNKMEILIEHTLRCDA